MKYLAWFAANAVWFGFFMYMISERGWSAWSLAVPIIFNWSMPEETSGEFIR